MTVRKRLIAAPDDSWLTIGNYKEPLRQINPNLGYGFVGALLETHDGERVQCHVCGKLFSNLGKHLGKAHDMTSREYKLKYALAQTSGLISETERLRRIEGYERYRQRVGAAIVDARRERMQKLAVVASRKAYLKKGMAGHSLEYKNKLGVCPDQILDHVAMLAKQLGYTPSQREFRDHNPRIERLLRLTFGTWLSALKALGMKPKGRKYNKGYSLPLYKRYTEEELLERMRIFVQKHRRAPHHSDWKQKVFPGPSFQTYVGRFGSIQQAMHAAGV